MAKQANEKCLKNRNIWIYYIYLFYFCHLYFMLIYIICICTHYRVKMRPKKWTFFSPCTYISILSWVCQYPWGTLTAGTEPGTWVLPWEEKWNLSDDWKVKNSFERQFNVTISYQVLGTRTQTFSRVWSTRTNIFQSRLTKLHLKAFSCSF